MIVHVEESVREERSRVNRAFVSKEQPLSSQKGPMLVPTRIKAAYVFSLAGRLIRRCQGLSQC